MEITTRMLSAFAMAAIGVTLIAATVGQLAAAKAAEPLKALIIDGENKYHDWQKTTPVLKQILEASGRFKVDVKTIPQEGPERKGLELPFHNYDVVVSNYNSQTLPSQKVQSDFLDYLRGGGGFVCYHAADNSFAQWPDYNDVVGLGGWYGRDKSWGPYVYYKDDKLVRDETSDGPCGHHGPQHEFAVKTRDAEHPIMKGLPPEWLHVKDELYDSLRGPAKNMKVLATAYSDPKFEGTGRDEPMLMVLYYGQGRVFHTAIGHGVEQMKCVGFITTLLRGTEWAATGEVTVPVPKDFPTAERTSTRE